MKVLKKLMILSMLFTLVIPPATTYAKTKAFGSKLKNYVVKSVPDEASSFKTYESYRLLINGNTAQGKLQRKSKTDKKTGIRMYKGRYCIALGSYYTNKIGTKVDLVMKNGHTLKCVLGDQKANNHTNSTNQYSLRNKDIVEFIVDYSYMKKSARQMGDMSYTGKKFKGKIKYIKVYK